jgi:hypothetical protein
VTSTPAAFASEAIDITLSVSALISSRGYMVGGGENTTSGGGVGVAGGPRFVAGYFFIVLFLKMLFGIFTWTPSVWSTSCVTATSPAMLIS